MFTSREWTGTIAESAELAPQWFRVDDIPYGSMWPDAPHWLPRVLAGERVHGRFIYDRDHRIYEQQTNGLTG